MIQVNELRISNTIERRGEAGIVYSIEHEHVWLQFGGEWGDTEKWLFESVEPIPLTLDWLEKMGFTFDGALAYNGIRVSSYFAMWDALNHTLSLDGPFGNTHLKFVHQVQNWYFGNTGEDLIIKQLA